MKEHAYINSNPDAFDSDCAVCGGKCRDCIHGKNDAERTSRAKDAVKWLRDNGGFKSERA